MRILTRTVLVATILANLAACKSRTTSNDSATKNLLPGPGFEALILEISVAQDFTIGGSPTLILTIALFTEAMCENDCHDLDGVGKVADGTFNFHISDKGPRHGNHQTVAQVSTKIIVTPDMKRIRISTYKGDERIIEIDSNATIVEGLGEIKSNLVAIGGETSGKGFEILGKVYQLDSLDPRTLLLADKHYGMNVRLKGSLVKKAAGVEMRNSSVLRITEITDVMTIE